MSQRVTGWVAAALALLAATAVADGAATGVATETAATGVAGASVADAFPVASSRGGPAADVTSTQPRTEMSLNAGWRFKQAAGLTGIESPTFDDSDWAQVMVPHTWNRIGNEGTERSPLSNSVQGVGWYRLRFTLPPASRMSQYFLQFDAVGAIADVWLNGRYLGRHEGAFARFRFDASAAIRTGENILVVKADNTRPQPGATTANVIPLSGDFFIFGGIYRSVSLIATHAVHVDMLDFGGPGVYGRSLEITPESATVQVSTRVADDPRSSRKVIVETDILNGEGRVVASATEREVASAIDAEAVGRSPRLATHADSSDASAALQRSPMPGAVTVVRTTLSIPRPRLWRGQLDPYLYRIVVTLRSERGALFDRITQPLGLRTVKFDPDRGFFLNGAHLFLKGVSMHQDRPVKGWAITSADQDEDFHILADLGANAVRLAHYQHDQRSYELADSLGIMAWAEIPLVNKVSFDGSPANAAFAANARQQLIELIRQNYNHPAVAVWSIGNEIDLTATQVKGPSKPAALLESLDSLAKSEDPGRPTTFADCCEVDIPAHVGKDIADMVPRDPIVGIADMVGYNRYFGWYGGQLSDFGIMLDAAHARHPKLPIAVSEYGAGAALTQHSDDATGGPVNPHGRPHPEEFQNLYHEASWGALRQRGYLWGAFIWNLFDFSSDSRKEGDLTDVNDKGLVSYDRQIHKDAFYFYRANWNARPTLHLVGRRYADRAYAVLDVKAYTNAVQAGLSLNGVTVGSAPCSGGVCIWRAVHLRSGSNELRASAAIGGEALTDEMSWTFAGSPAIVRIKAGDLSGYATAGQQRYGSDVYFTGGEGKGVNAPDTPKDQKVEVAAPEGRLYDSFREGGFSYRVPVPDGRYRLTLKFEEPSANSAGERVFNVSVNGKTVLKKFDIFAAAGGKLKAVDRTIKVEARDGELLVDFQPVKGRALLAALSIMPLE